MRTQQHLDTIEHAQFVMIYGYQSHATQTFTLHTIVHDVAKAV